MTKILELHEYNLSFLNNNQYFLNSIPNTFSKMKKLIISTFVLLFGFSLAQGQTLPDRKIVLETMVKTNRYFMQKHPDPTISTNYQKVRPSNLWTRAVYYEGLMALYQIHPDSAYYNYALNWAEFHKWGLMNGNTTRDADNQCAGQTYIDLYKIEPKPERIKNIKVCMDMLVNTPQNDDWSWIDAIQMGMPVLAQLGDLYHDTKYFEKMYKMYSYTRNVQGKKGLFNEQDGLWWRDANFIPPYKEPNGKDCYWSRGNGWVYAALLRTLKYLPKAEVHRKEYIADFMMMSKALKARQREDGFWNVSLDDPTNFGGKETTGTSLFVYGIAWGINNGILDKKEYLPVVLKAWNGLAQYAVQPNGFLGWVQETAQEPKGGQPLAVDKVPNFEDFGTGCFLLAASEVYKLD